MIGARVNPDDAVGGADCIEINFRKSDHGNVDGVQVAHDDRADCDDQVTFAQDDANWTGAPFRIASASTLLLELEPLARGMTITLPARLWPKHGWVFSTITPLAES